MFRLVPTAVLNQKVTGAFILLMSTWKVFKMKGYSI